MEKIIPNGTKVLIFNYIPNWGPKQDEERFIRGVIEDSEILEEETMHGSTWTKRFYRVLGEDNEIYYGTYDVGSRGSHYIRTVEDHINHIKNKITSNCEKINELNNKNYDLLKLITTLNNQDFDLTEHIASLSNECSNNTNKKTKDEQTNPEYKSIEEKTIRLAKENAKKCKRNRIIQNLNVLAIPCDKPIIILKDKKDELLSKATTPTDIVENATEFRENNLSNSVTKKKVK